MKKSILLVLLVYSFGLCAQTNYYWYRGHKILLEELTNVLIKTSSFDRIIFANPKNPGANHKNP
jgi:hypothetical protein